MSVESLTKKRKLDTKYFSKMKHKDDYDLTTYEFKDGWRYVLPYEFTYKIFCKERWFNKTILEVFTSEFKNYSENYYKAALDAGMVKVNDEIVEKDYILKNGDFMVHTCHKHEPPVLNLPIQITFEDNDYLIINKPPSIPLHPCGAYKFNTVLYILAKEYNKKNLYTVHRLDRLTSGLIMICKNKTMAYEIVTLIQNEKVNKTYLACVDGVFPKNEEEWLKSNPDNSKLRKYIKWKANEVKISIPTQPFSIKESIYECNENGKNTETIFKYRSDNGTTSVVECKPLTGRTHQIRLHLEWFKHPIANDPHYNPKMRVSRIKKSHLPFELEDFSSMTKGEKDWNKLCPFCKVKNEGKDEMDEAFNDIELSWKCIWLHALQYEYKDHWCYKVDEPDWAKPDFNGAISYN